MWCALHRRPRVRPVTCFPTQSYLNEMGSTINNYSDILDLYSKVCLLGLRGSIIFHVQNNLGFGVGCHAVSHNEICPVLHVF